MKRPSLTGRQPPHRSANALTQQHRPLIFLLDDDQDTADLVRQARSIGYDSLIGSVRGGLDACAAAGLPIDSTELLDAAHLDRPVVDVRQTTEHAGGHIPGALSHELGDITDAALPAGSLAVMCGHGERAATAASLLERVGRSDIAVIVGGPDDWAAAHGRLATGA